MACPGPALEQGDREVFDCITAEALQPFFALSWYITWFAHVVPDLQQIARLFDLFFSAHPLMPLYVGVAAMKVRIAALFPCCVGLLPGRIRNTHDDCFFSSA
jgi:Rab-GTPase-TBC domain